MSAPPQAPGWQLSGPYPVPGGWSYRMVGHGRSLSVTAPSMSEAAARALAMIQEHSLSGAEAPLTSGQHKHQEQGYA